MADDINKIINPVPKGLWEATNDGIKWLFKTTAILAVTAGVGWFGWCQFQLYMKSQSCHAEYLNANDLLASQVFHTVCSKHPKYCKPAEIRKLTHIMQGSLDRLESKSTLDENARFEDNEAATPSPVPIVIRGEKAGKE